jgi:hypothetical protein
VHSPGDAKYVARMEDMLDLYNEEPDPSGRLSVFDESPTQLIGEVREPIPAKPGQLERFDCEYRRNGTANHFIFLDARRPWRKVEVANAPRRISPYVCANCATFIFQMPINPGRPGQFIWPLCERSFTKPFQRQKRGASCAGSSVITPQKHASWLNMVEIEIGILRSQCHDRRIDSSEIHQAEIAAWAMNPPPESIGRSPPKRLEPVRDYPIPTKESLFRATRHRIVILLPQCFPE